jgi:formate hydrogenlyase subunit 4
MKYTHIIPIFNYILALLLAPLLNGVINRVKAWFAGRKGPPLLQRYYDIVKLLRKGTVYGATASWVFRLSAPVGLAAAMVALWVVPFGGVYAPVAFGGDILVLAYMLGLMRFFTIIAALDTGSSFEGMGASREAFFSALAEPALLLGVATIACKTGWMSLSSMLHAASPVSFELLLVVASFIIVYLCENSRIPIDDPATHLELTMIHEAMILDNSGPDLGFIEYSSSLKLWILGALIVDIAAPYRSGLWFVDCAEGIGCMILLAAAVGVTESIMARLRLLRVPQLLVAAVALSSFALLLVLR